MPLTHNNTPSNTPSHILQRLQGYLHRLEYCMYVQIDRVPWDAAADAGSKPWYVISSHTCGQIRTLLAAICL